MALITPNAWPAFQEAVYPEAADLLSKLIAIPSVNPPGDEMPCMLFIKDLLSREGLESTIYETAPNRGVLTCVLPDENGSIDNPVAFCGHLDVVPANDEGWEKPPFSGEIADGYIWGRGAIDMKGTVAAEIMAFILIKRSGAKLKRPLMLLCLPDEEVDGIFGSRWACANLFVTPESKPFILFNEGGAGVSNQFGLEVAYTIEVAQKVANKVKLTAFGAPGHGSTPARESAIRSLALAIARIVHNDPRPIFHPVFVDMIRYLGKDMKFPLSLLSSLIGNKIVQSILAPVMSRDKDQNAIIRNTVAVTKFNAGYSQNTIPERAEALVDIRLFPGTELDDFLIDLKKVIADDTIELEVTQRGDKSCVTPYDNEKFRMIAECLKLEAPKAAVGPFLAIGATDSMYFRNIGIDCYGIMPCVLPMEDLATMHGTNERLKVSALEEATRNFYRFACAFCVA